MFVTVIICSDLKLLYEKIKSPATTVVTCHIQESNEEELSPITR